MSGVGPEDGAALIGVDWGSSNLRVMRIARGGKVLAARADPRGANGLEAEAFPSVLADVAGDWLDDGLPVLICGVAGARDRWREQPYRSCPVALDEMGSGLAAQHMSEAPRIVRGVMALTDGRMADVMRGEETQVAGLDIGPGGWRVVAPGTHSKWITVADGRITGLRSFVTGELFALLSAASRLNDMGADPEAFEAGVCRSLVERDLTAALFSVRVEGLAGRLAPTSAADYLSGLLIGAEVAAQAEARAEALILVGAEALNRRYETALRLAGFTDLTVRDGAAATARGLWRIHEAATR